MLKGLYILGKEMHELIYGAEEQADIKKFVDIIAPLQTSQSIMENMSLLKDVEVIISGWGAPKLDENFLNAAPNLKAIFYGAGSVRGFATDAMWDRGIIVSSSWGANAIPVAEFTLAQILFSLKMGWKFMRNTHENHQWGPRSFVPGAYRSTVALISLGMIARHVLTLLKPFDLDIMVYSTSLTKEQAAEMGVRTGTLEEVFTQADVISLHTPNIPATQNMIRGEHFEMMKENATFINTARGAVINEPEMTAVLQKRPEIFACLDVTNPEPPVETSPLYSLSNVILTPHIAGSMNRECHRMGRYQVEEIERYVAGEPLKWQVTRELAAKLA